MDLMLVTGASRGIGRATALLAARNGYAVVINYLKNTKDANEVADEIKRRGGVAFVLQGDISSVSGVNSVFKEIDSLPYILKVLINNAGSLESHMPFHKMSYERLNRTIKSNMIGPMLCSQEAIKRMSTKNGGNGGSIVNVSSIASLTGSPNEYVDYAATKGALDTLTIGLANELASENIRVNGVRPGFIHTDIHASGGEPERIERVKQYIPMRRGGEPEEVAEAILWLASTKASFTTGTFINVTGGR